MPVSTAALISRGNAFLFVKRPPGGDLGECWELPGGKVDSGETPRDALQRELEEELGLTCRVGDLAATVTFEHRAEQYELQGFYVTTDDLGLHLREHTAICWATLSEGAELDLAPSDRSLIQAILGKV